MQESLDNLNYEDQNSAKKKIFDFRKVDYSEEITKQRIVENNGEQTKTEESKKYEEKEARDSSGPKKESGEKSKSSGSEEDIFDASNYDEVSEFVIELVDLGMSSLGKFISKEKGSSHKFEAPAHKKAKLSRQLSKILNKHKFAISIEFIFVISLVMIYAGPIRDAIKLRSENIEKEKQKEAAAEKKKQQQNENNSQGGFTKSKDIIEDAKIVEDTPKSSGRPTKEEAERKKQQRRQNEEITIN